MIKKSVTFTNYDGEKETRDLYFHLTKLEWLKLETGIQGGLVKSLENAISSQTSGSNGKVIELLEKIMLTAYGEKDENGEFVKDDALAIKFSKTEAFSELFYELAYNENAAQEFFLGLIPKDMLEEVKKNMEKSATPALNVVTGDNQ